MSTNILVVDDEESIRNVFARILEREGYNVVMAADGHEAIQRIESENFNLAVVDINIPGPDGIEILKYIKNANKDTEVIIISGYATLDTAIEAMRQGAYDYIVKPLDIYSIPRAVTRGLEKQKQILGTRQLLAQLEQRTFELATLYELRDAIGYTLDYRELVGPTMQSLRRVIDHDASAFLFITKENRGELTIWIDRRTSVDVIEQVKSKLLDAYSSVAAGSIPGDIAPVYVIETEEIRLTRESTASELQSFLNIALVIRDEGEDRLAGMISIGSYAKDAFDLNAFRLLYSISNNMSNALERLTKMLAGEKSKLEMMVKSMTDGVIMFDQRGHIAVLNPAARRMLGMQEIINTEHLAGHIGKNARLSKVLDRVWNQGDTSVSMLSEEGFEEEIHIENLKRFLSANVSPIKGDDGRIHGVVAVLRDITRRKEIDEAKSVFVSSVSHELRTPLTAIKNATTIVEMAGEVNEQQKRFLAISARNLDRLERLINDILDFSRLENGELEMSFESVNLKRLARESINALQNLATSKSIEIIESIPDDLPEVYADYHRLDQVFTNILDNAIKYTPEHGQIAIEACPVDIPRINGKPMPMPRLLSGTGFVEVSISDTGIGISPEDQKRIFGRFEQAGTSHKMGVGLGLSIVKKIIESHCGQIWVQSELGQGSRFTFILPADRKSNRIIHLIRAIDKEIEVAETERSPLSLIMIQIQDFADVIAKHGHHEADQIVADIAGSVQNDTHIRETRVFVSEDHGLIFWLCDVDKRAAADTEEGIASFVQQQKLPKSAPVAEVSIRTWVAVYPEDGSTAVELIDAVAQNCVRR